MPYAGENVNAEAASWRYVSVILTTRVLETTEHEI